MSQCDRTLSYQYVTQVLAAQVNAGAGTCVQVQLPQKLTFDAYPKARKVDWMTNDNVVMVDFWKINLAVAGPPFNLDTVVIVDNFATVMQWQRSFADTVSTVDQMTRASQWQRSFADTVATSDSFMKTSAPVWSDAITVPDAIAKTVKKVFADTVTVTDQFSNGHTYTMGDSVTVSDHGTINNQNYFDSGVYFAAAYFGYGYTW